MFGDVRMREWSDERQFSSAIASPSGAIFEAGSVHRWVGYMYRHWAFTRTTKVDPNQKSTSFSEPTNESNCCLSIFYTLLVFFFFFLKKKTTAFELPLREQEGLCWSHPGLIDICARAQSWAIFVAKDFGLAKLLAVLIGQALTLKRQPKFYWDSLVQYRLFEDNGESTYGALRKSIDCQACEELRRVNPPVAQVSFEKKKEKKPLVNRKSKNRQKEKLMIPAGRRDRKTGEGGKTWATFTVFSIIISKVYAARSGCPVSNPDPNTIGL